MKKKEKIDLTIAGIVTTLMLGFVLYYSIGHSWNNTDKAIVDTVVVEKPTTPILKADSVIIEDRLYTRRQSPTNNNSTEERIKRPHQSHQIKPHQGEPSITKDEVSTQAPAILPVQDQGKSTKEIEIDISKEPDLDSIVTTVIDSISQDQPTATTTIERSDVKDCIIIVGAYANKSNVAKLKKSLIAEGYDAFVTPYKGITRVGVYHSCDGAQLESDLRDIRQKHARDAVVLERQ